MSKIKNKLTALVVGTAMFNFGKVIAMEVIDVQNAALESYPSRYTPVKDIEDYLIEKGVPKEEYSKYIMESRIYRESKEQKWESVESALIIMDEVLFRTEVIGKLYNETLGLGYTPEKAYEICKKNFLNNAEYVLELFLEVLGDDEKMDEIFIVKYGRKPTTQEKMWLSDSKTIKYALYGGEIGREISKSEYELILNGEGYKILGLHKYEIIDYIEYATLRNKISKIKNVYYNSIEIFSNLRIEFYKKYNIDIYNEISESERLSIHEKSIDGIKFDEEKARLLLEKYIKGNDLIEEVIPDEEEQESPSGGSISQDSSTSNPYNDLNQYLSTNQVTIRDVLLSNLGNLYNSSSIKHEEGLKDTYIYIAHKGIEINTYIRPYENGNLSKSKIIQLIEKINTHLKSKTVFGKKELLILIESEVKTTELEIEQEEIPFEDIKKSMQKVGISLYEKNIKEETIPKDKVSSEGDRYNLVMNTPNEMYSIPSSEDGAVSYKDFTDLLEMLGIKYIHAVDSILLLRKNEVYLAKTEVYTKGFVSEKEFKEMLDEIGIDASLKIINIEGGNK